MLCTLLIICCEVPRTVVKVALCQKNIIIIIKSNAILITVTFFAHRMEILFFTDELA